jgi:hypothetical protein
LANINPTRQDPEAVPEVGQARVDAQEEITTGPYYAEKDGWMDDL